MIMHDIRLRSGNGSAAFFGQETIAREGSITEIIECFGWHGYLPANP